MHNEEIKQKLQTYRLNESEYERICELLGRAPQGVEWALFSALWSEHCSYKSSKVHLKNLFRKSDRVLEAEGENAGVVDLGLGERIAFKMESHNHPSYIEPYQGAATGVGGILRDIFTMGARPIALADYLCFGQAQAPRMKTLVDGVVRGIGGYGNCVGVPTVTGQTEFHHSYNNNILVNAMAVGLFRPGDKVFLSKAKGPGNYVVYVGAKTGRDGVHGASMASESFGEDSSAKRPTVQIGDPFYEKLLIESCLEVMRENLVAAIQDMGAAGLTSSSFEMASKGGVGLTLHLDKVPLRDSTLKPEDILLSESQERMLLICEPANFAKLQKIFHRWNLEATIIGEVRRARTVQLFWHGECLAELDPDLLVEKAPVYERPYSNWIPKHLVANESEIDFPTVQDANQALQQILVSASASSREWIYQQYDQRVGTLTAADCEESVAVLQLPDSKRGLGIVLGCRPYLMRTDARLGGADAIAYPALELAAKGFEALAVTDCLNYASPERAEVMSEFVASLTSLSHMCQALHAPIISGNVSFYNETMGRGITSTPSTGVVGLRPSIEGLPKSYLTKSGEEIWLLTCSWVRSGGQFQEMRDGVARATGELNPAEVSAFTRLVRELSLQKGVKATRVVGKYGIAYALARMCLKGTGANVQTQELTSAQRLFGETYYEVLWSVSSEQALAFREAFGQLQDSATRALEGSGRLRLTKIGQTGGQHLQINDMIQISVDELRKSYGSGWRKNFAELA